jgi:hypothetical protein
MATNLSRRVARKKCEFVMADNWKLAKESTAAARVIDRLKVLGN